MSGTEHARERARADAAPVHLATALDPANPTTRPSETILSHLTYNTPHRKGQLYICRSTLVVLETADGNRSILLTLRELLDIEILMM